MRKIGNGIRLFCFIFLGWLLLYSMERLFTFKSPEYLMMDEFSSLEKNSVDLLCVGSSHAYTSFDTEVYWNEFGIPAFCISGPGQPISYSYYYLKEAFKTQNPKVVLLEGSQLWLSGYDYEYGNINNTSWMPYSKERAEVLRDVMYETYRSNMEWNLTYFHRRWSELNDGDFQYVMKNNRPKTKGFNPWWNYEDYADALTVWGTDYYVEPDAKAMEYVDKIMALCNEHDAKLAVYLSAHNFDEQVYGAINWYRDYFNNCNIEMIDGVQLSRELGIDPEVDMCNGHIAYTGAVKLSKYIGNYLSEKQYVVDRRSEGGGYKEWKEWSHYYENTAAIYSLVNIKGTEQYINALDTLNNSIVVVTYRGGLQEEQIDGTILNAIRNAGLSLDFSNSLPYIAIFADGALVDQFQTECITYNNKLLGHSLEITTGDQGTISILADYERITKASQTIPDNVFQVYVYNGISGEVVESRTLSL